MYKSREARRAYLKQRRDKIRERIDSGEPLCKCGCMLDKESLELGTKSCKKCRQSDSKSKRKKHHKRYPARKKLGLCVKTYCDGIAVPGCIYCGRHQEEQLLAAKDQYERRKAEGRCLQCGKEPEEGKSRCTECLDYQRRYAAAYREGKRIRKVGKDKYITLNINGEKK